MGNEHTDYQSTRNVQRDLEAQPQATGVELEQGTPQELSRRLRSRPQAPPVQQKDTGAPTLSFYETFLDRASQDSGPDRCLFLCWGISGNQWAISVPVKNPGNETEIFNDIRSRWFEHRGRWRRLLPSYGVTAVKEVKVNVVNISWMAS